MAQVTRAPTMQQRVDASLAFSLVEWRSVPDLVAEWREWEPVDQLTFRHEWAIREDHLDLLARWRAQGHFSSEQQARYAELLRLVARHRSALDTLFRDNQPATSPR